MWLIWFIIKLPFLLLYYLVMGIWMICEIIINNRSMGKSKKNRFQERYLSSFTIVSSNQVGNYAPLNISKSLISNIYLDGIKVDIKRIQSNKIHCEDDWYDTKFDILLYYEGIVINHKNKYYFLPFNNTTKCSMEKICNKVVISKDPIMRLEQMLDRDYRYKATHYYTKDGELDRRYGADKYKDEFYLFSGEYDTYIKSGIVEIRLTQNLEPIYKIYKCIYYQLNKQIPSMNDMTEPSDSVILLTSADRKKIKEFLSYDVSKMKLEAKKIFNHIIEQSKQRYLDTCGRASEIVWSSGIDKADEDFENDWDEFQGIMEDWDDEK